MKRYSTRSNSVAAPAGWARCREALNQLEKWSYAAGLRSGRCLTLPHFLGIGMPRSGTTWLYRNLSAHPGVYLPRRKEAHYFDNDFYLQSLERYARRFRGASGRLCGEITPGYSIMPEERIRFIRRVLPEVRLILMLRNPVERAWSHARLHFRNRRGLTVEETGEETLARYLLKARNRARGSYVSVIDTWLSIFPEEQLYIGWFEEITRDPRQLLQDVLTHLGANTDIDWDALPLVERINAAPEADMPPRLRTLLEELWAQDTEELYQRFGSRVAAWRVPMGAAAPSVVGHR